MSWIRGYTQKGEVQDDGGDDDDNDNHDADDDEDGGDDNHHHSGELNPRMHTEWWGSRPRLRKAFAAVVISSKYCLIRKKVLDNF